MDTEQAVMYKSLAAEQLIRQIDSGMIYIPASRFVQGSTMVEIEECVEEWSEKLVDANYTREKFRNWVMKEFPAHEVHVDSYYLNKFPVTNEQYSAFANATGYHLPESIALNKPGDHPVWGVTIEDVHEFIHWINLNGKTAFRLPTESEWEYAAKANTKRKYPYGMEFNSNLCNTLEAGVNDTSPVGFYKNSTSPFGLYDMSGNVEEWTSNLYAPYPGGEFIKDDLVMELGEKYNVTRGGSFSRGGDLARCTRRHGPYPGPEFKYLGFRLAASNLYKEK